MNKIVKKIILSAVTAVVSASMFISASAADLSGWAVSEYAQANTAGLISYAVVSNNLQEEITREEFCELAVNLYKKLTGETLFVPSTSPFSDTDSLAVSQAYCYGIVSGTGDDTFNPDRLVTREEAAKMLVSTLTASEASFDLSDGQSDEYVIYSYDDGYEVSDWAKASVITILNYNLMNGVSDTEFEPKGSTTREQSIAAVNRSYEVFGDGGFYVDLPEIYLPTAGADIEEGDFEISWSKVSNADRYHIIIKDENVEAVLLTDVAGTESYTVSAGALEPDHVYSVIVGAVLGDSEVYSMPVEFNYNSKAPISKEEYLALNPQAQAILDTAALYLGTPYVWGGTTPAGFDCSGFAQYVYAQNGISINRVADDQLHGKGTYISSLKDLQPGDLVFFGSGDYASHVGIYVDNGTMIHSPSTGKSIMYTNIEESSYYTTRFIGGKRIIGE